MGDCCDKIFELISKPAARVATHLGVAEKGLLNPKTQ